jgi:hypothetical protein
VRVVTSTDGAAAARHAAVAVAAARPDRLATKAAVTFASGVNVASWRAGLMLLPALPPPTAAANVRRDGDGAEAAGDSRPTGITGTMTMRDACACAEPLPAALLPAGPTACTYAV